jgi:peptide/nickel transport system ATP-binding protein
VGLSIMNLIQYPGKITGGSIRLNDIDLLKLSEKEMEKIRWKEVAAIPQSAMNAMNPVYKIGDQIKEAIMWHTNAGSEDAEKMAKDLLYSVGIDEKRYSSYPHKLSGGMKQRAVIAMALSCNPKIIISDEATTGLDVLIQAQVLALLKKMQSKLNLSIIIISHDLLMVSSICDRIGIMYAGKLVEIASTEEIMRNPRHPYTKALFYSQISLDDIYKRCEPIPGFVPNLLLPPKQCRFFARCSSRMDICEHSEPDQVCMGGNHYVSCFMEG